MKWEDVRKTYPNTWVKFEILKDHIENDTRIIDDIALIDIVDKGNVRNELFNSPNDVLVYHTSKEDIKLKIRHYSLRRV